MVGGATRKVKKQYAVIDGVARKIKKSYQVVDGVARLFYSSDLEVSYTGTYTTSDVTIDGAAYTLWTLKGSGTLTVSDSVQYWMCGGGGNGGSAARPTSANTTAGYDNYSGGGGGGGYVSTGTVPSGVHAVTVGARAGASKISDVSASPGSSGSRAKGGNGASGGGAAAGYYTPARGPSQVNAGTKGTGKGVSTYPFGLTSLKAHCGGGGGGAYYSSLIKYKGGAGGTNGGSGGATASQPYQSGTVGGTGGAYGGGNGASPTANTWKSNAGSAATFYGGGGGGAARSASDNDTPSGGYGYQGVVYILVPKTA